MCGTHETSQEIGDVGHPSSGAGTGVRSFLSRLTSASRLLGMKKGEEFGLLFALMRLGFFQVFGSVFCEPGFVSMQEGDCVFDVLLCGPIGGAFTVVRYQVLEF